MKRVITSTLLTVISILVVFGVVLIAWKWHVFLNLAAGVVIALSFCFILLWICWNKIISIAKAHARQLKNKR